MFKTVAYHRAADAIARAPFDVARRVRRRRPSPDPRCRDRDRRQDHRDRDHRPHGLLRAAPRGDPGHPRRPAAHPGRRAEDGAHRLGRPRGHEPRRAKAAAEAGRLRELKGISASTEARILEGIEKLASRPRRLLLHRAQALADDLAAQVAAVDGGDHGGPGGLPPAAARDHRRPRPPRRDRPPRRGHRAVHDAGRRRPRAGQGPGQGRGDGDARAAGRPHGHAARRGRLVPRPLHRRGGPQHPAPGHRARPGLEPVGEGLRPDRRRGQRARGRGRRPPDVRGRGGRLRVPRPRLDPARAARGPRRGGGGAGRHAAGADHARRPARGPAQPLGLERRRPRDRGHGGGGPPARLRLPGPDRPLAGARDRARPVPGSRGAAARDHRRAQRPVRGRGGRGRAPARGGSRRVPAPPWVRAGGVGRRRPRLRRRAACRGSTSSWPRCTSPAASRGTSSRSAR